MISKGKLKLIKQLELKKQRRREGLFVAEGPKVVGELMKRWQPAALFATADYLQATAGRLTVSPHNVEEVSPDELRRASFLQHPQQVLALFPLPQQELPSLDADELVLALDGVQDPGNLGTIIRIADWFGISHVVCSEDTADAWNPKTVQATMGSIARVSTAYTHLPTLLAGRQPATPVYGTLLDGDDLYRQPLTTGGVIVMGNEAAGLSAEVRALVTQRLLIPPYRPADTAESLNVAIATAIVCAEFRRRT